eukprot:11141520-Heterocapsa_arctica.AAC.1
MLWSLPVASTDSCISWALRPNSLWNPPGSGVGFLANFLSSADLETSTYMVLLALFAVGPAWPAGLAWPRCAGCFR